MRGGAGDEVSDESWTIIHPIGEDGVGLGGVLLVVFVPQHLPCDFSRLQANSKNKETQDLKAADGKLSEIECNFYQ